jgi:hypothetical protein
LLSRVESNERGVVYDRMVALVPFAQKLSRADTVKLETATMTEWKEVVEFASAGIDPRTIPVATGTLKPAGTMLAMRQAHSATLLPDGSVLIAGGGDRDMVSASAELFDPYKAIFSETGAMTTPRAGHEATLLPNGKVLITGGMSNGRDMLASAELYDPATRRFVIAGEMKIAREAHRAIVLNSGKVLITGGLSPVWPQQRNAEIYDPATGDFSFAGEMTVSSFTASGNLLVPRHKHAAVRLNDGKVLIIGGASSRLREFYQSAELYDPTSGRFSSTGSMSTARFKIRDAAVLLADGRVLIAGGGMRLEVYDPARGAFSLLPDRVTTSLHYSTTTLLRNGMALIAGGYGTEGLPSAGAWLYDANPNR